MRHENDNGVEMNVMIVICYTYNTKSGQPSISHWAVLVTTNMTTGNGELSSFLEKVKSFVKQKDTGGKYVKIAYF